MLNGEDRLGLRARIGIVAARRNAGDEHTAAIVEDIGGHVLAADRLRRRLVLAG
ncbi:hypothetical protein [Sorangium sp. So ce385]|uniref:hypothetical protein n=1 Tax=Sorangium sp. So ce385 TaxID=3133308 RepID=UPI003F5BA5E8